MMAFYCQEINDLNGEGLLNDTLNRQCGHYSSSYEHHRAYVVASKLQKGAEVVSKC